MQNPMITEADSQNAQKCMNCPVCQRAREKQKGIAYTFVKYVEGGVCPACKGYEKVTGRKAHEPVPAN